VDFAAEELKSIAAEGLSVTWKWLFRMITEPGPLPRRGDTHRIAPVVDNIVLHQAGKRGPIVEQLNPRNACAFVFLFV